MLIPLQSQKPPPRVKATGWGLGSAVSTGAGLRGTRCYYLPLPLSHHCHGNAGSARCSSEHIPRHSSHFTTASSQGAGARGREGGHLFLPRLRTALKDHNAHLPVFLSALLFLEPSPPFRVFRLCLGGDGDCLIQWAPQVRKYHGQELAAGWQKVGRARESQEDGPKEGATVGVGRPGWHSEGTWVPMTLDSPYAP